MKVLSTHSFRFVREGKADVHLAPTKEVPATIPDDVGEDQIFGLARKSGMITVVETPAAAGESQSEPAPSADPTGDAGAPAPPKPNGRGRKAKSDAAKSDSVASGLEDSAEPAPPADPSKTDDTADSAKS